MKILCLGAGAMGALAAEVLAGFDEVRKMTIADLDLNAAKSVAQTCRGKATACSINVKDTEALTKLMKGHDVVANCVGPFFRFGVPILTCAIRAGVNYFDICDDPQPTHDMLQMGKDAKAAGIAAVVGVGATPGITNMLAAKIHGMFQEVSELHAAWNIETKDSDKPVALAYSAATIHWMMQCSGKILECRDGRLQPVKPLETVALHYPGRGTRNVWTVGHPEPVAFAWSYPEIKKSACYMVMPTVTAGYFKLLAGEIDEGRLTVEAAAHKLADESSSSPLEPGPEDHPDLPLFFVIGKGEIQGRKAVIAARIKANPPGMAKSTGIPLAIGVHQFTRGRIKIKGVATPEKSLDADAFFAELAPYCTYPQAVKAGELLDIAQEFE